MQGIKEIAHYIPADVHSNLESSRLEQFGVTEQFVKDKIGVLQRPRIGEDQDTSGFMSAFLNSFCKASRAISEVS